MITLSPPVIETVTGALPTLDFLTYGGIASGLLILALILQEVLDSESGEKHHYKKNVEALGIIIIPLIFVLLVTVAYKCLRS